MELLKNIIERQKIAHKMKQLILISMEEKGVTLAEALFLVQSLFGEAELSLYNLKKMKLIASTVLNEDILDAIRSELESINDCIDKKKIIIFEKKKMRRLRPGIYRLGIVPLFSSMGEDIMLAVEYYSKHNGVSLDKLEEFFRMLALVEKSLYLSNLEKNALRTDEMTMLPNREALIECLDNLIGTGIKKYSFGLITLANAFSLNEQFGMLETNRILNAMGKELGRMMPDCVYRVGGTKFGVVISGDVLYAAPVIEGVVDRIIALDKNIVTINVLCPLADSAYKTLFICESHLIHCDEDVVTVVRGAANEKNEDEFEKIKSEYFLEMTDLEKHTEESKLASYEENKKRKIEKDEGFVLNDMAEFEG